MVLGSFCLTIEVEFAVIEFTFDTETYLMKRGLKVPKMVCLSYTVDEGDGVVQKKGVLLPDEGCALLHEVLDDGETKIIGHNISFDVCVVCRHDPSLLPKFFKAYEYNRVHDTLIREKLINLSKGWLEFRPDRTGKMQRASYSLARLVEWRIGIDIQASKSGPDVWRKRYAELDGVPVDKWPVEAYEYAEDDPYYTHQIYHFQKQEEWCEKGQVAGPQGVQNEHEQVRADLALRLISAWGLRTDPVAVAKLKKSLTEEVEELNIKLKRAGLMRKNGSKNMTALRERVIEAYEGLGKTVPTTEKGSIKTCSTTLEESGDELLIMVGNAASSNKLLSSYIGELEWGTRVPLNPSYDVLKATGRTSSYDPNVQQLPRKGGVRECFVPREGYVYANIDYDTLELRVLAQVCLEWFGWSNMADAFMEGLDPHTDIASQLMGMPYEYVVEALKGKHGDEALASAEHFRGRLAKALNFGVPGGLSARSFCGFAKGYGVDVTLYEAESLIEVYFSRWKEVRHYFNKIDESFGWNDRATIVQPFSHRYRGGCPKRAAYNTCFQGPAADGAKEAAWLLATACYVDRSSPLFGSRVVAFVHDEFMLEVREEVAHEAACEAARLMRVGMEKIIKDVPITCEPALMRRWYKGAKTVYDAAGRLQCWEPKEVAA
ncbi:MAG: DNA polymerase [Phycisphaerales bacterium JB052]